MSANNNMALRNDSILPAVVEKSLNVDQTSDQEVKNFPNKLNHYSTLQADVKNGTSAISTSRIDKPTMLEEISGSQKVTLAPIR